MFENKNIIKQKFNKNNMFVISFLIFLSIAIMVGVIVGTKRKGFDVISIISIFYIAIPILTIIFTKSGKGFTRKTLDLFKFKEMKEMKKNNFTKQEEEKMKAFKIEKNENKIKNKQVDSLFVSVILIIYGLLLLISTIPSLILFQ